MTNAYLDTSAIVKRYLNEDSSDKVDEIFKKVYAGENKIIISVIVFGEISTVFDKYEQRGVINNAQFYYSEFLNEMLKLTKVNSIQVINITAENIIKSGKMCIKKHIPLMDTIHIVSAFNSDIFITADKAQYSTAKELNFNALLI
ncbi:type II toxin-antitoxin system VapC family toxin [Ferroplasma sp.]|uniref:type II toxin-antitoxin system VapC family toxin n=1 Tax=Ferroplasma sp. TaxID=2591003 RepID=UPI00307D13C9